MSLAGNCPLFHTDVPLVVIFAQANRASSRTAIPITAKHGRSISKNRVSETGLPEMNQLLLQGVNPNLMTCISIPATFSFQSFPDALWCCPVGDGAWKALGCAGGELLPLSPPRAHACSQPAWRNTEHTGTAAGKIQQAGAGLWRIGELMESHRPGSLPCVMECMIPTSGLALTRSCCRLCAFEDEGCAGCQPDALGAFWSCRGALGAFCSCRNALGAFCCSWLVPHSPAWSPSCHPMQRSVALSGVCSSWKGALL